MHQGFEYSWPACFFEAFFFIHYLICPPYHIIYELKIITVKDTYRKAGITGSLIELILQLVNISSEGALIFHQGKRVAESNGAIRCIKTVIQYFWRLNHIIRNALEI